MLSRVDHVIDIIDKAKRDKRTLIAVAGCVISFGVAIGAIAVYEHLMKELDAEDGRSYFRNNEREW